jgi:hypothetical protein
MGDDAQLAAVRFLREVEEARNEILHCRHCEGGGLMRNGTACEWCAAGFDPDVLSALGLGPDQMPP